MAVKQTIIVEDKLKAIFNYLNPILSSDATSFNATFKTGDQKELFAFFKQSKNNSNYPLIWLDMPYEEEHESQRRVKVSNMTLILAVETNTQMLNSERIERTFKPILYPLLDDILRVLRMANTVSINGEYRATKFPNYSDNTNVEESGFVDIWDAVKLQLDCTFNNNCLREIKF